MSLTLYRYCTTPEGSLGLLARGQDYLCYTLEAPDPLALPCGTYPLKLTTGAAMATRYLARFGEWHAPGMVEVIAPNRSYIFFHVGNYPKDTAGCILVGQSASMDPPFVGSSAMAYRDIYPQLREQADGPDPILRIRDARFGRPPWWRRLLPWRGPGVTS